MDRSSAAVRALIRPVCGGQSVERFVVKDNGNLVGRRLNIDFDGKVVLDRGGDCGEGILDAAGGGIVETAMGDRSLSEP